MPSFLKTDSLTFFLDIFYYFQSMYQAPYIFALNFWNAPVWNIEFDELDFLVYFKLEFYKLQQAEKSSLN